MASQPPNGLDEFDRASQQAQQMRAQRLARISASGSTRIGSNTALASGTVTPVDPDYSNATAGGRLANVGRRIVGLFAGVPRAPGQAIGSTVDFVEDAIRAINRQAQGSYFGWLLPTAAIEGATQGVRRNSTGMEEPRDGQSRPRFSDTLSLRSTLGTVGNDQANQVSTEILSLAVGYGAGSSVALATRAGQAGRALVSSISNPFLRGAAITGAAAVGGAVTDFVMVNPEQERFGNLLQSWGVDNAFVDWLAHDDGEGVFAGRFKNAVEGVLTGVAAESLMRVAGFWRASLRGDTEAAEAIREEIRTANPPPEPPSSPVREATPEEVQSFRAGEGIDPEDIPEAPEGQVLVGWGENEDGTLFPQFGPALDDTELDNLSDMVRATPVNEAELPERVNMRQEPTDAEVVGPPEPSSRIADDTVVFARQDTGQPVGSIDRLGLRQLGEDVRMFQATNDAVGDRGSDVTRALTPDAEARVGEMRIGPIGTEDNVPALLRALVERVPAQESRADGALMRDALAASNEIGEDPTALLEAARLVSGKLADADTAMAVLRTIWNRSAKDLDDLNIPGRDWEVVDDATFAQAAQAVHNMTMMSSYVQLAKQGLGRGLRVNQLPDADSYLRSLAKREGDVAPPPPRSLSPLPRTRGELRDWMDIWQNYKGDPARRAAFLQGLLTIPRGSKYLRQSFANFFTASILSAPRTLLLNLAGPGFISTVRTIERLSGAAFGSINPLASAAERASAQVVARETGNAWLQTWKYTSDAFYQAMQSAQTNRSIIGGGGQIEGVSHFGPFTDNLLTAAGQQPSWTYSLGNLVNIWPRALARVNNGLDEFSKRMAYQNEVIIRALVSGAEEGLEGPALKAHADAAVRNSFDETGRAVDEELLRAAERTTLTSQVGEPGTHLRGFANGLNRLRQDVPETRYLLPVFNVPANALGETLRRLPLAHVPGLNRMLGFQRTAAELAGDYGPVAQAEAHGRFLLGTSFLLTGVMMTRAGIMTGAGPQDPADRRVWLQTHQPYSIRIGDRWVRYDRFDVLGGLLSIPATVSDASVHRRQDKGVSDMLLSGAGALAQWFRDRAALRSAAGLLSLGEDPTNSAESVVRQLGGSIIQGFVPNALQATVTQTVDPYTRMRRDWLDYLKAALPGLSATLPPVRNLMGEQVQRASDTVFEGLFPVVMAPATSYQTDPVMDEMDRLYQATGYGAGADARSIGHGFFNPQDVTLENGRSLYDQAMAARQDVRVDGLTLREALTRLFASEDYNAAVDADSSQRRTSLGDLSRGYMVRQVFERYNTAIRAEIAQASPIARAYLTAAAAKQRDDAYLSDISADQLVSNPDLYRARGVDNQAYSERLQEGAAGQLLGAINGQ